MPGAKELRSFDNFDQLFHYIEGTFGLELVLSYGTSATKIQQMSLEKLMKPGGAEGLSSKVTYRRDFIIRLYELCSALKEDQRKSDNQKLGEVAGLLIRSIEYMKKHQDAYGRDNPVKLGSNSRLYAEMLYVVNCLQRNNLVQIVLSSIYLGMVYKEMKDVFLVRFGHLFSSEPTFHGIYQHILEADDGGSSGRMLEVILKDVWAYLLMLKQDLLGEKANRRLVASLTTEQIKKLDEYLTWAKDYLAGETLGFPEFTQWRERLESLTAVEHWLDSVSASLNSYIARKEAKEKLDDTEKQRLETAKGLQAQVQTAKEHFLLSGDLREIVTDVEQYRDTIYRSYGYLIDAFSEVFLQHVREDIERAGRHKHAWFFWRPGSFNRHGARSSLVNKVLYPQLIAVRKVADKNKELSHFLSGSLRACEDAYTQLHSSGIQSGRDCVHEPSYGVAIEKLSGEQLSVSTELGDAEVSAERDVTMSRDTSAGLPSAPLPDLPQLGQFVGEESGNVLDQLALANKSASTHEKDVVPESQLEELEERALGSTF